MASVEADDMQEARVVLDASALLAYLHDEQGGQQVGEHLEHASMSSVNYAEVIQKALAYNTDVSGLRQDLQALGLEIIGFDAMQAEAAALLWPNTKRAGLSLADRVCLALAASRRLPALTADRTWLQVSETARLIR